MGGTHAFKTDARNENIKIYVNGDIVPRDQAKVSVFDSGFLLGDGMWESFRLHNGKLAFVKEHMQRLHENAKGLDIDLEMSDQEIVDAIYATTRANHMETDVHIRLVVTRGLKATPFQNPRVNVGGPTLVIIPEYKVVADSAAPLTLYTVYVRRGQPDVLDPKLHPLSKLNCVLASIQVNNAGADEGLMLDPHGFVAACNSTSFFIVRQGEVWTSTGKYCLHGITRHNIIQLCKENGIDVYEKDFSLVEVYSADESFVTGTFGGVKPVSQVDGRIIGTGEAGPVTQRLESLYADLLERECA
ncbi:MAG: aminotransferase class IV [Desulfosarcinaceae bacterium]|nr:aminotransferase class IV [Desulfosarcinaceae bacterium]